MLRIRLRRVGKKKQPMYRIVVADSRSPRDGDFVDSIGIYHPMNNPSTIELDQERAKMWLERGAQPSDRVVLRLYVAEGDMGKVIGKQGRIANAMRDLLKVAAARHGTRASLEIGD